MALDNLIFFPQEENSQLTNKSSKLRVLYLLRSFVKEIINAIESFYFKKELFKFDPHVGETLCQIRACKILLLAEKNKNLVPREIFVKYAEIKSKYKIVEKAIVNFEKLIENNSGKYNKNLDAHEQLRCFFEANSLIFQISKELFFLTIAHLLSRFVLKDEYGISFSIDYEKFGKDFNISKSFGRRIIRYFQQNLADLSCDFIELLLRGLPEFKRIKQALPFVQLIDNHNRKLFPCYEVTQTLIAYILKRRQPILIIVHRLCDREIDKIPILFWPNSNSDDFICELNLDSVDLDKPCLIIRGISLFKDKYNRESPQEFIRRVEKVGIKKIVLANMAKHPQFSADELSSFSKDPYSLFLSSQGAAKNNFDRYNKSLIKDALIIHPALKELMSELQADLLKMQRESEQLGCCIENPSLFFIKHIYCDTIRSQLIKNDLDYSDIYVKAEGLSYKSLPVELETHILT